MASKTETAARRNGAHPENQADGAAREGRRILWQPDADEADLLRAVVNDHDAATRVLPTFPPSILKDEKARCLMSACKAAWNTAEPLSPALLASYCQTLSNGSDRASEAMAWSDCAEIATGDMATLPKMKDMAKGAEEIARRLKAASPLPPDEEDWSEPLPLRNSLFPVPQLNPLLIPEPMREWTLDCATRIAAAPDYIAAASIVALASLIGNTISIRPKQRDDWRVVPNLWGALVGNPSVKKSPAIAEALKPLSRLKAQAIEKWHADMKAWKADSLLDELDADALKKDLRGRQKSGATREELRAMIEEQASKENSKPILKTYSVQDSTIEAHANTLSNNPRGFLIDRDELTGWLRALDKQGHEQDRAFYLEAFSGTAKNQQIERIGRGTILVPHFTISILGTIQPLPLAKLIRGATSGENADGFVARFQMLVYPDAPPKYVHVDEWPKTDAKNRAFAIFDALDNLTPEEAGAEFDGDEAFLRFSPAAQAIFNEWLIDLENRLPHQSPMIEQHLAKYRSLMPSLALIFHLIDFANRTAEGGAVGEKAAAMAAEWCEFLEAHARRIYAMASDGATDGAELIASRFGQLANPFTAREVHQKRWAGLSNHDDVESALARLEDRGWIRPQNVVPETGRPTVRYWKHPAKAAEK